MAKSQESPAEGVEVHYSGRVQGVGFRVNAQQIARGYAVVGFVRNLDDSRVHLRAEGEPGELKRFLDAIAASMGLNITGTTVANVPATGRFSGFEITS